MNQKIEIENRNRQMNWRIELENRNWKLKLLGMFSSIGVVFLVFWILVDIFICKIDISDSDSENTNPKIENEIQNSGRLPGDDVEASGFAGNWNEDFYNENEIQILNLTMVEYSHPPVFNLTEAERKTIQYIVAGEAKGEPMEGKMAVAQCILHGMVKSNWSAERVRIEYQYSGWDDELKNSNPDCWAEVCEAVSRVFDDGENVTENPILFFYAPKRIAGKWHKTLPHDQVIGNHSFHYLDEDVNADWFLNLRKDV